MIDQQPGWIGRQLLSVVFHGGVLLLAVGVRAKRHTREHIETRLLAQAGVHSTQNRSFVGISLIPVCPSGKTMWGSDAQTNIAMPPSTPASRMRFVISPPVGCVLCCSES